MVPAAALSRPLRSLVALSNATAYERLIGRTALDVLFYFPTGVITWETAPRLTPALHRHTLVFQARLVGYRNEDTRLARRSRPFIVKAEYRPLGAAPQTPPQPIQLVFFYGATAMLMRNFPLGKTLILKGPLNVSRETFSIVHPTRGAPTPTLPHSSEEIAPYAFEPVYALSGAVQGGSVRRLIEAALQEAPNMPEWIPEDLLETNSWPSWKEALEQVHHPKTEADLTLASPAKQRLVFDELLTRQIRLAWQQSQDVVAAQALPVPSSFAAWVKGLPFALTTSQTQAIKEIQADLAQAKPMRRLLQGDVGSGKTLVALAAALQAIEAGAQVAFLAPTDVLARQHFETAKKVLPHVQIALYTAQQVGKTRTALLSDVQAGRIQLLVGTHALIQECVQFAHLGLAIIDEQHRFGVEQRERFSTKLKEGLHTLNLSATPIPRTLLLSLYGDVSVSVLTDKPAHQQAVQTRTLSLARVEEIERSLVRPIERGEQIYWVCPLIKDSAALNLVTVEARFQALNRLYPGRVALLHGQMSAEEKERVMADFYANRVAILVATTVIEIGVDAPNATVMIVENAERFGLAQLHQLRGRVGRGEKASSCLLLYGEDLTEVAKKRLALIRDCADGFKVAEADMILRGSGDVFGTQQSGKTGLRLLLKVAMGGEEMETYIRLMAEATKLGRHLVEEAQATQKEMIGNLDVAQLPPSWSLLLRLFSEASAEKEARTSRRKTAA